jgi:murein DD-endopeptidase MepM/ murein hydrolase activator NlpD
MTQQHSRPSIANHPIASSLPGFCRPQLWLIGLYIAAYIAAYSTPAIASPPDPKPTQRSSACPPSILSNLQWHEIALGDTLASIADRYDLRQTTLVSLNPSLHNGIAPVGTRLAIPPYDGIRVEVREGTTWQDIAERYEVRADRLFELNGCQPSPSIVFIPGASDFPDRSPLPARGVLTTYPLPDRATVIGKYGWMSSPDKGETVFHSGVDLRSAIGTSVLAAGAGTVAFAGEQGPYGNLVVINHSQGRQTRYAHLKEFQVKTGDTVTAGTQIGTVGQTGTPDADEPHLHFEVRYNSDLGWVAEDPQLYLTQVRE